MTSVEELVPANRLLELLTFCPDRDAMREVISTALKQPQESIEFLIPNFQREGVQGSERLQAVGYQFAWTGSCPHPTPIVVGDLVRLVREEATKLSMRVSMHAESISDIHDTTDFRVEVKAGRVIPRHAPPTKFDPPLVSGYRVRCLKLND